MKPFGPPPQLISNLALLPFFRPSAPAPLFASRAPLFHRNGTVVLSSPIPLRFPSPSTSVTGAITAIKTYHHQTAFAASPLNFMEIEV
jgi:hypothetical protein